MNLKHIEFIKFFQSHINYIKSGLVKFLIYDAGSGGEFLSLKISQYSSNNYFKYEYTQNEKNRYFSPYNLLGNIFYMGRSIFDIADYESPEEYYLTMLIYGLHSSGTIEGYQKYLNKLNDHILNGNMIISRTHHFIPYFMNNSNSYYLYPDNEKMHNYRMKLWKIKTTTFDPNIENPFKKNLYAKSIKYNLQIIKMSKMFEYGYLESIFNIEDDNFHEDLMLWHEKNLSLISSNT